MNTRLVCAFFSLTLVSGCGTGVGGDSSNSLSEDRGVLTANYMVLDLVSGTVEFRASIGDMAGNPAYRDRFMVFILLPSGNAMIGSGAGSLGEGIDQAARTVFVPSFACAVYEVTRAQWQRLAGNKPWESVVVVPATGVPVQTATNLPANALCRQTVEEALAIWNVAHGRALLSLPSDIQWERACRADSGTDFAWGGNPSAVTTASIYAATWETSGLFGLGFQPVGARQANAFGLYDCHGNAAELTSEGHLRGGSWYEPISQCRAARREPVDQSTAYALSGCRLVLTMP